jgi:hypothetical protein
MTRPFTRPHLLKFPPCCYCAKLEAKSLMERPLRDIKMQIIAQVDYTVQWLSCLLQILSLHGSHMTDQVSWAWLS